MEWTTTNHKGIAITTVKTQHYQIAFLDLGGTIYQFSTYDQKGQLANIVLSYQDLHEYHRGGLYLGANIGRFAGRLPGGVLQLGQDQVQLPRNDQGRNALHGGLHGLHNLRLTSTVQVAKDQIVVTYQGTMTQERDHIPGQLDVEIKYLCRQRTVTIQYRATTDRPTICNLTNHTYFNLHGNVRQSIASHILEGAISTKWLTSDDAIPVQAVSIPPPTGKDPLSLWLGAKDKQTIKNRGLDNPFQFTGPITLFEPATQRKLRFWSSYDVVVLYSQGFVNDQRIVGRDDFATEQGLALEFQYLPGQVGPRSQQVILNPGQTYNHFIKIEIL